MTSIGPSWCNGIRTILPLIALSSYWGPIQAKDNELATKDDIIKQLEEKNCELELAYNKLWRERFEARSERYISDPGQLCLDFGNTADAADAAAGLADAVEEADLVPAHRRRKPRKKRDESLPEHLPRYEVTADVPEELKNCAAHGERTLLPEAMWDKTETLEFERKRAFQPSLTASLP